MGCGNSKVNKSDEDRAPRPPMRYTYESFQPKTVYYNYETGSEHYLDLPKPVYYNPKTGSQHHRMDSAFCNSDPLI
ncbi:hypothetical protein K4F52_003423 [Lecanicillium sp. MT-2017a]|nr:hypothetical protein K4F52_003423 [Lecanicillium sp. MT-2017a]